MAGDHKCPLCSATFTRPQHVGRHLRAHTGDRPYECKECPLRFARSDLLSRHVNKAHRPPDENAPPKEGKKGRRKSMGSNLEKEPIPKTQDKARAASFSLGPGASGATGGGGPGAPQTAVPAGHPPHVQTIPPVRARVPPQASYPNQPPFSYNADAGPSGWTSSTAGLNPPGQPHTLPPQFTNPFGSSTGVTNGRGMNYPAGMIPPFTGAAMKLTASEQGSGSSSSMGRNSSMGSWNGFPAGFDFGFKKRACDQCNHSKVRCDFADPCVRCVNKNMPCTYNKPQKSRSSVQPIPFAAQRLSLPNYTPPNPPALITSVSPESSFTSPYSTSPLATTANFTPVAQGTEPVPNRRVSVGAAPPLYYTQDGSGLPGDTYNQQYSMAQQWQAPGQQGLDLTTGNGYIPQPDPLFGGYEQQSGMGVYDSSSSSGTAWSPHSSQPQPSMMITPLPPQRQISGVQTIHSDESVSPSLALAPTPALTSHSTSPSGPDEPSEQRSNSSGMGGYQAIPEPRIAGNESMTNIPLVGQIDCAYPPPTQMISEVSPVSMNPPLDMSLFQPDYTNGSGMTWPSTTQPPLVTNSAPAAIPTSALLPMHDPSLDLMYQYRTTHSNPPPANDEDDATASVADSTALASFLDMDETTLQNTLEHRRRSSVNGGIWATAFNNMTLHDSAGNPLPLPLQPNLDTYAQANTQQPKRPSMFPLDSSTGYTDGRMPSMSDVKDLWKLFMTDPMTGPTPSKEKLNNFDFNPAPIVTPRPDLGRRTLSKSNSMPDLKSPLAEQAFFTQFYNNAVKAGNRPEVSGKESKNGASGVQHGQNGEDGAQLDEWKNEIKHRQSNFLMTMQPPKGKSTSPAADGTEFPFDMSTTSPLITQPALPMFNSGQYASTSQGIAGPTANFALPAPTHTMARPSTSTGYALPGSMMDYSNSRPMASILQRSSAALDQTLGPERAPSFGLQNHYGTDGPTPTASTFSNKLPYHTQAPVQQRPRPPTSPTTSTTPRFVVPPIPSTAPKPTSASARPGNKRLASQTLVGADEKKATFTLFGAEEEDEGEGEGDEEGFDQFGPGAGIGAGGMYSGMQAVQVGGWQGGNM